MARAARVSRRRVADTFAEGVATRKTYDLTFDALHEGLAGFVTVTDAEIAERLRTFSRPRRTSWRAPARGLRVAPQFRDRLAGKRVGIVFCGGNIDVGLLRRVLAREI